MRLSTFLKLLLAIVLGLWISAVVFLNADLLRSDFLVLGDRYLPLWLFLVLVFFSGLGPPMAVLMVDRARLWFGRKRREERDRARADIDQLLTDVAEAELSGRVGEARRALSDWVAVNASGWV